MDDAKKSIEKVETLGHELRSAGGHLKNAARAVVGKDPRQVDGGQKRHFQSAVFTPMRTVQKLLTNMNNATLAAIGNVEGLETAAEAAREAKKPPVQQEQEEKAKPEQEKKEPEPKAAPAVDTRREKPSIRQTLNEKKAKAAALLAPDQERKAPEAAR